MIADDPRELYPRIMPLLHKAKPPSERGIISFVCPSHPDNSPSAICYVHPVDKRLNFKCLARGCTHKQILDALGLKEKDRRPQEERKELRLKWVRVGVYEYKEANGLAVARKIREHGLNNGVRITKRFFWESWVDGKWKPGLTDGLILPIFNLGTVISRKTAEAVYLTEGESCAEAVSSIGLIGTTLAHTGNRKMSERNLEELSDCDLVVIPDSNNAGAGYLEGIVSSFLFSKWTPKSISVLDTGEPKSMDIKNWIDFKTRLEGRSIAETRMELEQLHGTCWTRK